MAGNLIVNVDELIELSDEDFAVYAAKLRDQLGYNEWFDLLNRGTEKAGQPDYAKNVQKLKDLDEDTRRDLYEPLRTFFAAAGIRRWLKQWTYKTGEDDHIPFTVRAINDLLQAKAY